MARGKTLGDCLTGLRAEMRLSLNPAHNAQVHDTHVQYLQRSQEHLWESYTWPHLRVERFLRPQVNQRYYDPAGCKKIDQTTGLLVAAGDIRIDNVERIVLRDGTTWSPPLKPGILPEHMNQWDSDAGQQAWPPQRWQVAEGDNVEIWPIPSLNGDETTLSNMLKFTGIRNLAPFAQESDRADLDDQLIILFTAAKLMSGQDAKDKMVLFNDRLLKIRGNATKKRRTRLFGRVNYDRPVLRGYPTVYYRTTP